MQSIYPSARQANPQRSLPPMGKGQVSAEFISILGIGFLIVLFFLALSASRLFDINAQQNYNNAHSSAVALAEAADSVYAQGEGASRTVTIILPGNTNFGTDYTYIGKPASAGGIIANTIGINVNGTDVLATTDAPLSGSFPASSGTYLMKVISRGSSVYISPYLVDLDAYSVSIAMGKNQTRTASLRLYKMASEDVNISIHSGWGFSSDVEFSVLPTSFSATSAGTAISMNFTSNATAADGLYSSQLIITVNGTTSGAIETISIPITVNVQ